jgi:hypothetical protein
MSAPKSNRPSRNFAPLPLAVLASDAPPRAKLLMLAIFHHDWDGEKAWPGQERLARIMSTTVDTVQRATQDCRDRGWLTTHGARREGLTYEINVPDMNLQQFERAITTSSRSRKLRLKVKPQKSDSPSRNLRFGQAANCGTNREPLNENQEQRGEKAAHAAPPSGFAPTDQDTRAEAVLSQLDPIREASRYGRPVPRSKATRKAALEAAATYGIDLTASYAAFLADDAPTLVRRKHPLAIFNAQPETYHTVPTPAAAPRPRQCPDCKGSGRVYRTSSLEGEPCDNAIHHRHVEHGHA